MTLPDGAVHAMADVVRISQLDGGGYPATGLSVYTTRQQMKLTLTPVMETGDDLVVKSGDGNISGMYKHGDMPKYYTAQFEHASPDPVLEFMLCGGTLLADSATALATPAGLAATPSLTGGSLAAATYSYKVAAYNEAGETLASGAVTGVVASGSTGSNALSWSAVTGAVGYLVFGRVGGRELLLARTVDTSYLDTGAAIPSGAQPLANTTAGEGIVGYQAPTLGIVAQPNGVGIELWGKAIVDGVQATDKPFFRWVFPRCAHFHVDARDFTNAILQNVYAGAAFANPNWGRGPMGDFKWDSSQVFQAVRESVDTAPIPSFAATTATA